jgi:histidinol-phosphatase (PHP family)
MAQIQHVNIFIQNLAGGFDSLHLERGDYTKDWLDRFIETAESRNISEIWLLEHCYRSREFVSMYDRVCAHSDYINKWFHSKAGVMALGDYLRFMDSMRKFNFTF